jgi:hypothetical protein
MDEPEFIPLSMKIRDIVNIQKNSSLRTSQRHSGAGRVFDLLVTNRILGFKKMIALQEIDEDYPEKQQNLIKI